MSKADKIENSRLRKRKEAMIAFAVGYDALVKEYGCHIADDDFGKTHVWESEWALPPILLKEAVEEGRGK